MALPVARAMKSATCGLGIASKISGAGPLPWASPPAAGLTYDPLAYAGAAALIIGWTGELPHPGDQPEANPLGVGCVPG
jgi:hypothetical protein